MVVYGGAALTMTMVPLLLLIFSTMLVPSQSFDADIDNNNKRASMPTLSNRVIAQFLDRLSAFNQPAQIGRTDWGNGYGNRFFMAEKNDERGKRNNAEVVNHIIKNFGQFDRLGDVGRR